MHFEKYAVNVKDRVRLSGLHNLNEKLGYL